MKALPFLVGITAALISFMLWSAVLKNSQLDKTARTLIPSEYVSIEEKNTGSTLISGEYFVGYTISGVAGDTEDTLRQRVFDYATSQGWKLDVSAQQDQLTKANSKANVVVLTDDGSNPGPPYARVRARHRSAYPLIPVLSSIGIGLLVLAGTTYLYRRSTSRIN